MKNWDCVNETLGKKGVGMSAHSRQLPMIGLFGLVAAVAFIAGSSVKAEAQQTTEIAAEDVASNICNFPYQDRDLLQKILYRAVESRNLNDYARTLLRENGFSALKYKINSTKNYDLFKKYADKRKIFLRYNDAIFSSVLVKKCRSKENEFLHWILCISENEDWTTIDLQLEFMFGKKDLTGGDWKYRFTNFSDPKALVDGLWQVLGDSSSFEDIGELLEKSNFTIRSLSAFDENDNKIKITSSNMRNMHSIADKITMIVVQDPDFSNLCYILSPSNGVPIVFSFKRNEKIIELIEIGAYGYKKSKKD